MVEFNRQERTIKVKIAYYGLALLDQSLVEHPEHGGYHGDVGNEVCGSYRTLAESRVIDPHRHEGFPQLLGPAVEDHAVEARRDHERHLAHQGGDDRTPAEQSLLGRHRAGIIERGTDIAGDLLVEARNVRVRQPRVGGVVDHGNAQLVAHLLHDGDALMLLIHAHDAHGEGFRGRKGMPQGMVDALPDVGHIGEPPPD